MTELDSTAFSDEREGGREAFHLVVEVPSGETWYVDRIDFLADEFGEGEEIDWLSDASLRLKWMEVRGR